MAEYIDRDAIYTAFANAGTDVLERASELYYIAGFSYEYVIEILDDIPTADVTPVVHGRWIERRAPHAMGGISAKCSACSKSVQYLGNPLNYCPHCGAKMDIENGRR